MLEQKLESLEAAVAALTSSIGQLTELMAGAKVAAPVAEKATRAKKAEKEAPPAPAEEAAPEPAAAPALAPPVLDLDVAKLIADVKATLVALKARGGDPKSVLQKAGFGAMSDLKTAADVGKVTAQLDNEVPY